MRLNRIDDAGAENLKRVYGAETGAGEPPYRRLKALLHLGLLAWRESNLDAARQYLSGAAETAVDVFSKPGSVGGKPRRPNHFDLPLMVALAFGSDSVKEQIARLPRSGWFQEDDAEYKPLADLFDILRGFEVTKRLDRNAIKAVLEANETPEAQFRYKPWVRAMAEGLLAVAQKKKPAVEKAAAALLQRHEKEAEEGDWKYLVEGLMATWALVLYRVARDCGIDIEIDSPYFPKDSSS